MEEAKPAVTPFVIYDFFGYLLPGFFFTCIFIFEYDFSKAVTYYLDNEHSFIGIEQEAYRYKLPYLMKFLAWEQIPTDFKVMPFILMILALYLLGHIIAAFSSSILEKFILSEIFGYPTHNLFQTNLTNSKFKLFMRRRTSRYCLSFDPNFIIKFKEIIDKRFEYSVDPSDYYWLSFTDVVRAMPNYYQRIQHFVSLYGFTRNTCAAFLLYVPLRIGTKILYKFLGVPFNMHATNAVVLFSYTVIGIVLYISYIKHFKRQTMEMFLAFYSFHTKNLIP